MSSNGGGGSNLLDMGLMIAAGVAAPELAPLIMEGGGAAGATFMGLEGAGGLAAATGVTGAGLSGLAAAATGQDPIRAAALGGLGGAASGYLGGVQAEQEAANAAQAGMTGNVNPNVSTNPSIANYANAGGANMYSDVDPISKLQSSGALSGGAGNVTTIPQAPVFQPFNASTGQMAISGGINALGYNAPRPGAYTPPNAIYTGGPLQKFKYDPNNYQPDIVKPPTPLYQAQYAEGGITSLAAGGNPGQFDNPLPNPQGYKLESTGRYDAIPSASDSSYFDSFPEIIAQALKESPANSLTMNVRPAYAAGGMASGGISTLGSYSDGGRLLKGPGDGMSDSIPAMIGKKQEARLADGEFVVPSDVVSGLGNGSTDAGARHLYKMMDKVRHARTGRKTQGKQIKADKYVPA